VKRYDVRFDIDHDYMVIGRYDGHPVATFPGNKEGYEQAMALARRLEWQSDPRLLNWSTFGNPPIVCLCRECAFNRGYTYLRRMGFTENWGQASCADCGARDPAAGLDADHRLAGRRVQLKVSGRAGTVLGLVAGRRASDKRAIVVRYEDGRECLESRGRLALEKGSGLHPRMQTAS
jgi:hypothetical protein